MQQVNVRRSTPLCFGEASVEQNVSNAKLSDYFGIMLCKDSSHAVDEKYYSIHSPGMQHIVPESRVTAEDFSRNNVVLRLLAPLC
jgi:hypothetical protein